MIDELLLLSGNDLPFIQARLVIHQPKLKQIAYITEQKFWTACQLLKFDKEILPDQDRIKLLNMSNFNIIMMMMQGKDLQSKQAKINVLSLLALLFPTNQIKLDKKTIQLRDYETKEVKEINQTNFNAFREILINMFCLTNTENKQYNPSGDLAKKIADKIKKGQMQRAKLAPDTKINVLSRYPSILAVGQKKNLSDLMNYTVYQLMDEFNRFQLKTQYDIWLKYKVGGFSGMEDPQDWLKDIHKDS